MILKLIKTNIDKATKYSITIAKSLVTKSRRDNMILILNHIHCDEYLKEKKGYVSF